MPGPLTGPRFGCPRSRLDRRGKNCIGRKNALIAMAHGLPLTVHAPCSWGGGSTVRDLHVTYMARIVPTLPLHFHHPWRSDVGK